MPEIPLPDPPLSDRAVTLRPWRAEDAPALVAGLDGDVEIGRWTVVPQPYTPGDARRFLDQAEPRRRRGEALALAIEEDGAPIGSIDVRVTDWEDRRASLGYLVFARARGRGVATRAVRLLTDWCLGDLGLERLEIRAEPENTASHRVAERAGFVREAVLRGYRMVKGRRVDMVNFARLRGDPPPRLARPRPPRGAPPRRRPAP